MSKDSLQSIIGIAIVNREFREGLLTSPLDAVSSFELTDEERAAVGAIRAKNIEQFAARLDLWLSRLPIKSSPRRTGDPLDMELMRIAG